MRRQCIEVGQTKERDELLDRAKTANGQLTEGTTKGKRRQLAKDAGQEIKTSSDGHKEPTKGSPMKEDRRKTGRRKQLLF